MGTFVRVQSTQISKKPTLPAVFTMRSPVSGLRDLFDVLPAGSNEKTQALSGNCEFLSTIVNIVIVELSVPIRRG